MSRLVSYFSLTLLFTLCACFVDYAFVIVVIKESYYYYYYPFNKAVRSAATRKRVQKVCIVEQPTFSTT